MHQVLRQPIVTHDGIPWASTYIQQLRWVGRHRVILVPAATSWFLGTFRETERRDTNKMLGKVFEGKSYVLQRLNVTGWILRSKPQLIIDSWVGSRGTNPCRVEGNRLNVPSEDPATVCGSSGQTSSTQLSGARQLVLTKPHVVAFETRRPTTSIPSLSNPIIDTNDMSGVLRKRPPSSGGTPTGPSSCKRSGRYLHHLEFTDRHDP